MNYISQEFPVRGFLGFRGQPVRAVDDVSFNVAEGEVLGIVGETGCGKSTLAKIVAGIQRPIAGWVNFSGRTISSPDAAPTRSARAKLQYVYQDPGASLDPRWKLGRSLHEPLITHTDWPTALRKNKLLQLISSLELPPALLDRYPHELSGGQKRRMGLARILLLAPKVVIFDEPTAGLDSLVQASVLKLLRDLRLEFGLTYLVISHDISVVSLLCDRVAVMQAGRFVEIGTTQQILVRPAHPYTRSLLAAYPRIGRPRLTEATVGDPTSNQTH